VILVIAFTIRPRRRWCRVRIPEDRKQETRELAAGDYGEVSDLARFLLECGTRNGNGLAVMLGRRLSHFRLAMMILGFTRDGQRYFERRVQVKEKPIRGCCRSGSKKAVPRSPEVERPPLNPILFACGVRPLRSL
jgi:hypothetical protein